MPRSRAISSDEVINRVMHCFWHDGYSATSMDSLVKSTGVSRHILYGDFGGKDNLFEACLANYRESIVTPAFEQVETSDAGLRAIERYFECQISHGEAAGLPGPGCLFANTQTEIAPHHEAIATIVEKHNDRLLSGFRNALANERATRQLRPQRKKVESLAVTLVIFTNGLWSFSRTEPDASRLRLSVSEMLQLVEQRIGS